MTRDVGAERTLSFSAIGIARKWGQYLIVALGLALLLHFGDIDRHFDPSPDKAGVVIPGPTTGLGDNYYYYAMLRHVPNAFHSNAVRPTDPDGGDSRTANPLTNAYPGALATGYLLFRTAGLLVSSPADLALVTSILHTMFLTLALLLFLDKLSAGAQPRALIVMAGCLGIVFVDAFALSVWMGRPYFSMSLLTYYSNATRIVSPTLYWGLGLLACWGAASVIRGGGLLTIAVFTLLSAVLGLTSLAVGATLLTTLSLYLAAELVFEKRWRWPLFPGALALALGLAWSYWQIHLFQSTPVGQEIQTGSFLGFDPNWKCLIALALVPWFWKFGGQLRSFAIALIVSSAFIGFAGASFHLGDRFWLRGAAIFVWALALYAAVQFSATQIERWSRNRHESLWRRGPALVGIALLIGVCALVYRAQNPTLGSWRNFVAHDKWEVVEWINKHTPEGAIVATTDPEFSYLLPVHSSSKPLFSMFGLTARSLEDELLRYFFTTRLYGVGPKALADLSSVTSEDTRRYIAHLMGPLNAPYSENGADAVLVMELVLYHSHSKRFSGMLADPERHREFVAYLEKTYEQSASRKYSFDYAIITISPAEPSAFKNWPIVFENERYRLLKRPADATRDMK